MSKNIKLIGWSGDYYSPLHYVAVQNLADNLAKINEANLHYYDPFRQLPNEWTEDEVRAYEQKI